MACTLANSGLAFTVIVSAVRRCPLGRGRWSTGRWSRLRRRARPAARAGPGRSAPGCPGWPSGSGRGRDGCRGERVSGRVDGRRRGIHGPGLAGPRRGCSSGSGCVSPCIADHHIAGLGTRSQPVCEELLGQAVGAGGVDVANAAVVGRVQQLVGASPRCAGRAGREQPGVPAQMNRAGTCGGGQVQPGARKRNGCEAFQAPAGVRPGRSSRPAGRTAPGDSGVPGSLSGPAARTAACAGAELRAGDAAGVMAATACTFAARAARPLRASPE